ncbi:MAG: Trp family transcriptional regulator, partial [Patescibacteria group bacterium]|nr:Trp family transcriptional regulator [Patescibacteria group bacterium]
KYRLFEKAEAEIKSLFTEIIALLSRPQDIADFLDDFLTPTERIVLSKRITVALLLKQGCSYEVIMKTLKVSAPTVANVSLKLKYSGKGYHRILDKILAQQKIKGIFDKIENFGLEVLTIGRGKGTGVWYDLKIKKQQAATKII